MTTIKYGFLRNTTNGWYLVPSELIEEFDIDTIHVTTICWEYKDYKDIICPDSDRLRAEYFDLCVVFNRRYLAYYIGHETELSQYKILMGATK